MARPRFEPTPCPLGTLDISRQNCAWLALFETVVSQLIHHPEYNSTLILRSDTIADSTSDFPPEIPVLDGAVPLRNVHRLILPRRPGRDASLEQHCTLYGRDSVVDTLVLTPVVPAGASLPYYHPAVHHLAFCYIPSTPPSIRIEVVLLDPAATPTDPGSRIYRTCLALLDALHRYGWGALTNYQKRVHHDCLVPREVYQDIYLIMRERFKGLVETWVENTDPLKHVFEDIGIATYLILLWKDTFPPPDVSDVPQDEPWRGWGRPPGGFLDFGCGNGLLTHILLSCGYAGIGIDLRSRASWDTYPAHTQAHLRVDAFDPRVALDAGSVYTAPGRFIIANHADELTPWAPLLATGGYLSIPCCAWVFDARFERGKGGGVEFAGSADEAAFADTLNLGADNARTSGYAQYRVWLARLSVHCGWVAECDVLRIPSTRNWALVGRRRTGSEEEARANVAAILQGVRDRGLFKTRTPEGKAGREH
ncbi:hypothetical protein B0H10DRAFT_1949803 [Mycena sp. CBHHK59/15]|nr:hypothetical protein B0H10DRAFT_1949803 [Mycena sp. CBHHK59/15]